MEKVEKNVWTLTLVAKLKYIKRFPSELKQHRDFSNVSWAVGGKTNKQLKTMWIWKTVSQRTNDIEESKALNFQTILYTNSSASASIPGERQ